MKHVKPDEEFGQEAGFNKDKAVHQWGKFQTWYYFCKSHGRGDKRVKVKEFLVGLPVVMSFKAKG